MEVNADLRRMIHRAAPSHELREVMRKSGNLSLREEGAALAMAGKSSLEEVLSVTHGDEISSAPSTDAPGASVAKEAA
jgi:type II secretory ATPase GspE/PulE/Tfp pilus assembly ATPase PilB-like protein